MRKNILTIIAIFGLSFLFMGQKASAADISAPNIPAQTDSAYDSAYNATTNKLKSGPTSTIKWYIDNKNVLHFGRGKFQLMPTSSVSSEQAILNSVVGVEFNQKASTYSDSMLNAFNRTNTSYIYGFENLDTSKVTIMRDAFSMMPNLKTLDVSKLDTSSVTNMSGMFNSSLSLGKPDKSALESLKLGGKFNTSKVTDMTWMFNGTDKLKNVDFSLLDTSSVTNMSTMFAGTGLTSINTSTWNVSNVTNFSNMFYGAQSLTSVKTENWNVSKATNMTGMFQNAKNVTELDVSKWNVGNVTTFSKTFFGMNSLPKIDVSKWNPIKVNNTSDMFGMMFNVEEINLSGWTTPALTNMRAMFNMSTNNSTNAVMPKLKTIVFGENMNTSKVTDMGWMFNMNATLTNVNLDKLNMTSVKDASNMLNGLKSMEIFNLQNWETPALTNATHMFSKNDKLKEINMPNINMRGVTSQSFMMAENPSLIKFIVGRQFELIASTNNQLLNTGASKLPYKDEWHNTLTPDVSIPFSQMNRVSFNENPGVWEPTLAGVFTATIDEFLDLGNIKINDMVNRNVTLLTNNTLENSDGFSISAKLNSNKAEVAVNSVALNDTSYTSIMNVTAKGEQNTPLSIQLKPKGREVGPLSVNIEWTFAPNTK